MNARNVTLDDALNSTSFAFQPANCTGSGWDVVKDRGYMGTYTSCTKNTEGEDPSANVTFTGVAVYYTSTYIEGDSVRFRLDGNLSAAVDLSTPSGQATNKTATKIFWKATNLTNGVHSLQLLPGNGTSTLTVDALIITQINSSNITTSSVSSTAAGDSSSAQGSSNHVSSTTKFSYALGITFGILSFLIFLTILIALGRRRRELRRFMWSKPIPPLRPPSTSLYSQGEHTGTQDQSYVASVHSPKMEQAHSMPLRPLPTAPRSIGSPTIHEAAEQEAYDDFDTSAGPSRSWPSPAPSSRLLLSPGSLSSRGNLENMPSSSLSRSGTATTSSTTKLEPVRRVTIL